MVYIQNHIPISNLKRPNIKILPKYLTIHSTANPSSTALNERNWLTNPSNKNTASWHIVVDEKEAIEAIPLNEIAYHAGTSEGNHNSIGIEICESGNRQKVLDNTVSLVAKMLFERNWSIDRLRRHFDWSRKNCPRILNDTNWDGWHQFKQNVFLELSNLLEANKVPLEEEIVEKRYNSIDEIPDWGKTTVKKLIDKGYLFGGEQGHLDLSNDMIRLLVINDRAGLYDS